VQIPDGETMGGAHCPDKVTGLGSSLERSISAAEESWGRLIYAWGGFVPFGEASSADALVSVHEDQKSDHNTAASALRQAMSAGSTNNLTRRLRNVTFRLGETSCFRCQF
jgi:hypothetical protein